MDFCKTRALLILTEEVEGPSSPAAADPDPGWVDPEHVGTRS